MPANWESNLDRWAAASLVDAETVARIRAWESERSKGAGLRWPTLLALAAGAILMCAGVLLFVSAHWDNLSPAERFSLVVAMVGVFHAAGALVARPSPALSIALHTVGTVSLGAGIALTGQIFNLDTHWPSGIMLWSIGAVAAWLALRHWTQAALAAILIPFWLSGEWEVATENVGSWDRSPVAIGIFVLAVTYLSARKSSEDSLLRRALAWIGAIAFIPAAAALCWSGTHQTAPAFWFVGWAIALGLPLALAFALRGAGVVWNLAAAAWALILYAINHQSADHLFSYVWAAVGCVILVVWGMREHRPERINFGVAAFAITVGAFYFSSVMDKLGRSASLIGLGILFLAGGWALERTRRTLIANVGKGAV